jgi:S-adenosylmethionine-dependent methyltransferase
VLLLAALRGRRRRLLAMAAVTVAWMIAMAGAFLDSRVVLGFGLVAAGAVSVLALKLLLEVGSDPVRSSRRPAWISSQGASVVAAPSVGQTAEGPLELYTDRTIGDKPELVATVRHALIEHHFSKMTGWTDEAGPEHFRVDLDRHSYMRHDAAVTYIVPWVNQAIPLEGSSIVEVGCGTGSSTAAFASLARIVHGYDISPSSIAAAEVRLDVHGLADRVDLVVSPPAELLESIESRHTAEPVDVVLLYALLEHQTVDERIQTLRVAEKIVRPGGAIVITETPNRLTYVDRHTSQLPFFHLLPLDLQLLYADRSPRATFAENIAAHRRRRPGEAALRELMIRWGQSVSFHDFEVALGDVNGRVLSSGLHPNLMKLRPERPEEKPLRDFLRSTDLKVHPGFTRYYLDLIISV